MNFEESFNFFINYILISPLLCYLILGIQLLFKRYSKSASTDQILEQEKLIKEFRTRFTKSSLNKNLQVRELAAQKIAQHPNVSGRFVAYCLNREIYNINYVMFLYNYTKNIVTVPDIEGSNFLKILESKRAIKWKFIAIPVSTLLISSLLIFFTTKPLSLLTLSLYFTAFIFSIWSLLYSFPYLCTYLLQKDTECVFLTKKINPNKKSGNNQQDTKSHKNLCYLIECARSKFGFLHMSVQQILKNLERKQMSHDDRYHKDIWVLNTQDKARHMAAHIGKYSGQILEVTRPAEVDKAVIQKYIIDSLIINFSYANIFLNLVSKKLDPNYLSLSSIEDLIEAIGKDYLTQKGYTNDPQTHGLDLAMDMCILSGKILKTVESLDHVEQHNFRDNFNQYTIDIFKILMTLCHIYKITGIENLIADRMYEVEQRHVYFDVYGNYKDGYQVL